eukprot:1151487-Pelagomonas_calceolata.AAC.5
MAVEAYNLPNLQFLATKFEGCSKVCPVQLWAHSYGLPSLAAYQFHNVDKSQAFTWSNYERTHAAYDVLQLGLIALEGGSLWASVSSAEGDNTPPINLNRNERIGELNGVLTREQATVPAIQLSETMKGEDAEHTCLNIHVWREAFEDRRGLWHGDAVRQICAHLQQRGGGAGMRLPIVFSTDDKHNFKGWSWLANSGMRCAYKEVACHA